MKTNLSLSGFPDFNPLETKRREYILSIIKDSFKLFGFLPISTASIEKRSNLFGNYGDDGEKLIFQILKNGNYLSKANLETENLSFKELSPQISDKALRYDLTLSLARFVARNQSEITFPFKRYEIGSVFRADRPQKGRLREFVQCDADIVGDKSLWLEVDLLTLMTSILTQLKLKESVIKLNNRKILEGLFQCFVSNLTFSEFCIIIDKIEKIGVDKMEELLLKGGFLKESITQIKNIFSFRGSLDEKKEYLFKEIGQNDKLITGFDDLSFILNQFDNQNIQFDITLARGLDYYTGTIFEVFSSSSPSISLAGGGRYDRLTEKFGVNDISGVGFSIGLDRTYLELESLNLFPNSINTNLDILFLNFGYEEAKRSQSYINKIRNLNKSVELFPSSIKINKQMSYANKRGVKFVVMIGEDELQKNVLTIKNMLTGQQNTFSILQLIKLLKTDEL